MADNATAMTTPWRGTYSVFWDDPGQDDHPLWGLVAMVGERLRAVEAREHSGSRPRCTVPVGAHPNTPCRNHPSRSR